MTKSLLVSQFAQKANVSKKEAAELLEKLQAVIFENLKKDGDTLTLMKIGRITVYKKAGGIRPNPRFYKDKTAPKTVNVPAKNKVKFKTSSHFETSIN